MEGTFSILKEHPPREGLTVSVKIYNTDSASATAFSLGSDTDISPESYNAPILYATIFGEGKFLYGESGAEKNVRSGDALIVNKNTLCGVKSENGLIYIEILIKKEMFNMNKLLKAGEVFRLSDLVPYENGGIANMDVVSNEGTKFAVMAFDEGCALPPHRAPGDAIIFALEGKAVIDYEGKDYQISAGENFRFEKNGLHSVKADGKFKMALLLTLK